MGQCSQCCKPVLSESEQSVSNVNTDGSAKKRISFDFGFSSGKSEKKAKSEHKHQPLPDQPSSRSQSTGKNNMNAMNEGECGVDDDDEEYSECIDISQFQDDVIEFTEFWHQHFDTISRDSIHNALVARIHNKVKEEYPAFPREAVDQFIQTLPHLLESLETLINIAIDGDVGDAMSMYQQYEAPKPKPKKKEKKKEIVTDEHGIDIDIDIDTDHDSVADEEAYSLFMGMKAEEMSDMDVDDPSVPLKRESFEYQFDIENADDAEVIMVGIMRTLWFDRVRKYVTKYGLDEEIDDLFFLLSNALETAVGSFREYKAMMEAFALYTRRALRTTLELIRAIINDLPLQTVSQRTEQIYDDPYSILIHFADRCEMACSFWNCHIGHLPHESKQRLSMRVYSYAILNVQQKTYEQLKQKGSIVRWSSLLLDFMETIIRFFDRNRHHDLMQYLLILASYHEKMHIPSTLLANMGQWLDDAFSQHFEEQIYTMECSDGIQFVFAFVGEVMSGAYVCPIYDTQTADQITADIRPPAMPQNMSTEFEIPTSLKSVVMVSHFGGEADDVDEELTVPDHCHNDSNYTYPKPGGCHMAQTSFTFNPATKSGAVSVSNKSVLAVTNLDLDAHPSLNDILKASPVQTPVIEASESMSNRHLFPFPARNNISCPPPQSRQTAVGAEDGGANNLKPPISISQYFVGNSPLSRLDSPTASPQPIFDQPTLTPNPPNPPFDGAAVGDRAVTLRNVLNFGNEEKEEKEEKEETVQERGTMNKLRRRHKKRSYSQADHHLIKYLAPHSQHSQHQRGYTKSGKKSKSKKVSLNVKGMPPRTSSSMLLDKEQEKNWKPMHFLQKIMDLEGKKIISNYAFAPSDGSLSEKIVDLSIFHQYFETAYQFWSHYVDINEKNLKEMNDKLLNVFSQRITDSVRYKISQLFACKQTSFVEMFSLYFKLVNKYLDKCKIKANRAGATIRINPVLLHANTGINNGDNNNLPSCITPSLKHRPKASHKRTFSQRSSLSVGLTKFKLRADTARDQKVRDTHNHFHAEGQFFVLQMLRIGTKHRAHNIEERTLKLVAKCLIEVIEKQFAKRFNGKKKRAFTIALKLGIKFMCVEPGKKSSRSNVKYSQNKQTAKANEKETYEGKPPVFRAKSAQTTFDGFTE